MCTVFILTFTLSCTAPQRIFKNSFVGQYIVPYTVVANASPLTPILELGAGTLGSLGLSVSAPVVVGVASVLVLAGVCFHYREQIEGVCGYIAQNVAGAVVGAGSDALIDGKKCVDAYNKMRLSGVLAKFGVTESNCPFCTPVWWGNQMGLRMREGDTYTFVHGAYVSGQNVPSGSVVTCVSSGIWSAPDKKWANLGLKFTSGSLTGSYLYSNVQQFPDGSGFFTVNISGLSSVPVIGQSCDVAFPSGLSPAKDIGNDTFARIPKDASVSAQNVVDMTAPQIAKAKDIPISLQAGEGGVAVPLGKVLNPDGSIPLTGEGDISIPKTVEGEGTATGDIAGEGTTTGDTTAEGEGTATGDITGSLDKPIDVSLDFSPLKKIGGALTKVFPFCVPWDLIHAFQTLRAPSKEPPKWNIQFDRKYFKGGGEFEIDFSRFETFAEIVRFFVTLAFTIFLILKTRDLIKG